MLKCVKRVRTFQAETLYQLNCFQAIQLMSNSGYHEKLISHDKSLVIPRHTNEWYPCEHDVRKLLFHIQNLIFLIFYPVPLTGQLDHYDYSRWLMVHIGI